MPPKYSRALAALALVSGWALFFAPHLFTDDGPYYRDALLTFLPVKAFLAERLRAGHLPQWYPYESLGVPFIGQVVTATFHPQTLLSLALSPVSALKANTLGAYLFAAAGGYRCARASGATRPAAVGGAFALAFTGYALGMSNNLPFLVGLATLPWVLDAALRLADGPSLRRAAALALVLALLFLSGDAQSFALAPLLLLAALPAAPDKPRALALGALAFALALLVSAAELLPALHLARLSLRANGDPSPTLAFTWSLAPLRLPELVSAGWIPDAARSQVVSELLGGGTRLWSSSIFAGALALFFAALGAASRRPRALALVALALFATALALGGRTPLLPLCWKLLPLLARFRYPEKYLAVALVALCPLVALGLDRARRAPARHAWQAAALALALAVFGCAIFQADLVGLLWSVRGHALASADPLRPLLRAAWSGGLLTSAALLVTAAALLKLASTRPGALAFMPALILAELWLGNGNQLPLVPRRLLEEPSRFAAAVRGPVSGAEPPDRVLPRATPTASSTVTLGDGPRWVASMRLLLRPDVAALDGLSSFGSTLPGLSLRAALALGTSSPEAAWAAPLFAGCFRVDDAAAAPGAGDIFITTAGDPALSLYRQPCLPRARLTGMNQARGPDAALAQLRRGLPAGVEVWEGGPALPPAPGGSVRWVTYQPDLLRLEVETAARAALVIADELQPGWTAAIDGAPAALHPADVALRGLLLEPGPHLIELRYSTPGLAAGLSLSLVGLVATACCALLGRRGSISSAPARPAARARPT